MIREKRTARVLALDIPIALGIGAAAMAGAHFGGGPPAGGPGDTPQWGPGGTHARGGPPWADGGGDPGAIAALPPAAYACIAAVVVCLAVRRFHPLAAFACAMAAVTVFLALGQDSAPLRLGLAVLAYTAASLLPLRQWTPWLVLAVPMFLAGRAELPYFGLLDPSTATAVFLFAPLLLLPAALGVIVRSRRETARRERDQELRRSAYEERLRIAREVHDVVGHSLSVINMQAGVALHVLGKRPEQAEPALQAIRQTSKDALVELRGTLAVFRAPEDGADGGPAGGAGAAPAATGAGSGSGSVPGSGAAAAGPGTEREPVPGLGRLDELTAGIGSAGHSVDVRIEGERTALPAALDHAAYRIVQEALTNAVRHSGGTGSTVVIGYRPQSHPEELTVEITDNGPARRGGHQEGSGIAGMRERARAVGGRLEAGPRAEGGFRVRAELPLGER
ncbi:histidine kinase [Streptomonospora sediminis]